MLTKLLSISTVVIGALALASAAQADDFDLTWFAVDGGGGMFSTGGDFDVSATIGQPDVGAVMTGGTFELNGGFWAGVPPFRAGDMNCDGAVSFTDINPFVLALTDAAGYRTAYPDCDILNGDCNGDGRVNFDDINPFVALLSGG